MGNRVGIILHEDWEEFSPLLYSHYGAELRVCQLREFLIQYKKEHDLDNHDGHLYNPCHMMVGYLQHIDKNVHIRVENLSDDSIKQLQETHEYLNGFDGGCWIVNVSTKNFGETIEGDNYYCDGNIVDNDLKSPYDYD